MSSQAGKARFNILSGDKIGLIVALIAIVILFSMFNPNYASSTNMINILVAASLTGLVAIGETYLIIAGMIDMSTPSVAAFASVLAAVMMQKGAGLGLTILATIVAGLLVGWWSLLQKPIWQR